MGRLFTNFLEMISAFLFFLAAASVVVLFPLLFFALPIVMVLVLVHRYLVFHKIRYHALEVEDEANEVFSAQVIDLEGWKKYRVPYDNHLTAAISVEDQAQIDDIQSRQLQEITDSIPDGAATTEFFTQVEPRRWVYTFHSYSFKAEFNSITYGHDPQEAFSMGRAILMQQIREWHIKREKDEDYVGLANPDTLSDVEHFADSDGSDIGVIVKHKPAVLIIEDDAEVALATEQIFKQLGCETTISDGHDGTQYRMSFQNYDFIVLDWMLGDNLLGDQIVQNSVNVIDLFTDLRSRFEKHQPKIITYSVLDRPQVQLPKNDYFYHLDHWHKPAKYSDLAVKASEMLAASGY